MSSNGVEKKHLTSIDVYTDGSFRKTPKGDICGYGIYFPGRELKNVAAPLRDDVITNNRAELRAIYQAIVRIAKNYTFDLINIYTDSEYCQKSLTTWIVMWKQNNWKNAKRKPVENQDIIMKIDRYMQRYQGKINIQWVRAHTGGKDIHSVNNAKADRLANMGADKYGELILDNA
ncbi:ribonuclease H [Yasminevirus sp. GU-2018]|uniref:ribonuclease H n=1 Tax=Yasminevirus sp. GU-2018 TaxID=2420051 RepID=A0A5K0U798_9VIRU|nr:ribonuclease H [Yasminevirus sp. GU-2018]